jgi:hypothetical protein
MIFSYFSDMLLLKVASILITTIASLSMLVAAQEEDVITVYAPSLRPAPSGEPLKDVNALDAGKVLSDVAHLEGNIDGISAIGYGYEGGRWYVGVHKYSVVVSTTASQLTTVTLPTPTSKTSTYSRVPSLNSALEAQ